MRLIDEIGEPALLELVAEECVELAHAALKLARVERGENPTPRTREGCRRKVEEEWADVMITLSELAEASWTDPKIYQEFYDEKQKRMEERISDVYRV